MLDLIHKNTRTMEEQMTVKRHLEIPITIGEKHRLAKKTKIAIQMKKLWLIMLH